MFSNTFDSVHQLGYIYEIYYIVGSLPKEYYKHHLHLIWVDYRF